MSKKKKEVAHKIPDLGEQQARVATPADETLANISNNDFQHVVIVGIKDNDSISIVTSFNTFESIHAALNRANLEVIVNHNRVVNDAIRAAQEVSNNDL